MKVIDLLSRVSLGREQHFRFFDADDHGRETTVAKNVSQVLAAVLNTSVILVDFLPSGIERILQEGAMRNKKRGLARIAARNETKRIVVICILSHEGGVCK